MTVSDPFSCFGDSSESDEDNNNSIKDSDSNSNLSNLIEGKRLKDKCNTDTATASPIPISIIPIESDSFVVYETEDAGMSIRAAKAYKCGELIMQESAAMRIPNSQSASSSEAAEVMHQEACQRAFNSMHPSTKSAFLELSSCRENDEDKTPHGIYDTNSYRLGDGCTNNLGGLFLTLSRMNHSCMPNVNHYWREELQMTLIFACRDIAAGEEMCTIYGPSHFMDTKSRRQYLHERFAFICHCQMCTEGNLKGGDDRMAKMNSLLEDIALSPSSSSSSSFTSNDCNDSGVKTSTTLALIQNCLGLMKDSGLGAGVFTKSILHQGYIYSLSAGDRQGARSYLVDELKAVQDSEGRGCPRSIEIQETLCRLDSMIHSY